MDRILPWYLNGTATGELVMGLCRGHAVAITRFERPVGVVQSFVVTCECGWESKKTKDWRRSLDAHFYRALAMSQRGSTAYIPPRVSDPVNARGNH